MLHRTVYGSLERFIGVLIEETNGRLPTWLTPTQVRVLSFTDRNQKYPEKLIKQIGEEITNIRMDADFTQTTVQSKVKNAEIMRIPFLILAGDKEEKNKTLAVRRNNKVTYDVKIEDFIKEIKELIEERK